MDDAIILEGLRGALARGESLRKAMMSFYNAGYKKEEIEAAARALQMEGITQPSFPQLVNSAQKSAQQKPIQRVSGYEFPRPGLAGQKQMTDQLLKRRITLWILISLLAIMLGGLAFLFIFKEHVLTFIDDSKFFNRIFEFLAG